MMLSAKKGISSLQVRRVIFGEESGTDWRTCWYICHRWRAAMSGDGFDIASRKHAEIGEPLIGGKNRDRHSAKRALNAARDSLRDRSGEVRRISRRWADRCG